MGSGTSTMIQEIVLDGSYIRLALLVTLPFLYCISLVRISLLFSLHPSLTIDF